LKFNLIFFNRHSAHPFQVATEEIQSVRIEFPQTNYCLLSENENIKCICGIQKLSLVKVNGRCHNWSRGGFSKATVVQGEICPWLSFHFRLLTKEKVQQIEGWSNYYFFII